MPENPLLLTVDVEPDWGIEGDRSVAEAMPRLLDAFSAKATFFVVGALVPSHRELFARAAERHEIASHGHSHVRLDRVAPERTREELSRSMDALASLGRRPLGVRAPFFRTPPGWCGMVREAGYRYDASVGECRPSFSNAKATSWKVVQERGLPRLGTCALKGGLTPFCLTYQRLLGRLGRWLQPPEARLFYFHLHELMPKALGGRLPLRVRWLLTRNAGEPAWEMIERLLSARGADTVTCAEFLGL